MQSTAFLLTRSLTTDRSVSYIKPHSWSLRLARLSDELSARWMCVCPAAGSAKADSQHRHTYTNTQTDRQIGISTILRLCGFQSSMSKHWRRRRRLWIKIWLTATLPCQWWTTTVLQLRTQLGHQQWLWASLCWALYKDTPEYQTFSRSMRAHSVCATTTGQTDRQMLVYTNIQIYKYTKKIWRTRINRQHSIFITHHLIFL